MTTTKKRQRLNPKLTATKKKLFINDWIGMKKKKNM